MDKANIILNNPKCDLKFSLLKKSGIKYTQIPPIETPKRAIEIPRNDKSERKTIEKSLIKTNSNINKVKEIKKIPIVIIRSVIIF